MISIALGGVVALSVMTLHTLLLHGLSNFAGPGRRRDLVCSQSSIKVSICRC